jgi:GAF domain-containing protein
MRDDYSRILLRVSNSDLEGAPLRRLAMEELDSLDGWDWSGIYRLEGDELLLDEYVGAATDHTVIPVGRGVCGAAVAENRNQVVADVNTLDNYLSCSISTKSEIVVLVRRGDTVLGQIDIDGHKVGQFGSEEEEFLEALALLLSKRWG